MARTPWEVESYADAGARAAALDASERERAAKALAAVDLEADEARAIAAMNIAEADWKLVRRAALDLALHSLAPAWVESSSNVELLLAALAPRNRLNRRRPSLEDAAVTQARALRTLDLIAEAAKRLHGALDSAAATADMEFVLAHARSEIEYARELSEGRTDEKGFRAFVLAALLDTFPAVARVEPETRRALTRAETRDAYDQSRTTVRGILAGSVRLRPRERGASS